MPKSGRLFQFAALLSLSCLYVPETLCATEQVWDFRTGLHGWKGSHQVEELAQTREGITFRSTGIDPWIEGRDSKRDAL